MNQLDKIYFPQPQLCHLEISPHAHIEVGENVHIRAFASISVSPHAKLILGERVFFNDHCTIRCQNQVRIGKDTMFGDGVRIFDHNHTYSNYHVEKIDFQTAPVTIGKNCWIGSNSVILKGVTIGDNVIIGANSLIYKDIPSNSLVMSKEELIIKERKQHLYQTFTLTASDTLEHLAELVESLPEVNFNIAAKTSVSPYLESFNQYENVTLWTNVHHEDIILDLLDRADLYLDINHWEQVDYIVEKAHQRGKRILAFDTVAHKAEYAKVFSKENPEEMVQEIRLLLGLDKEYH